MRYLAFVEDWAKRTPDALAFVNSNGESMTYAKLWSYSASLAQHLQEALASTPRKPVVVYGHKNPLMLVSFIACMRSGHPYVPVDMHSVPQDRVASIIDQIDNPLVLCVESLPDSIANCSQLDAAQMIEICEKQVEGDDSMQITGEDIAYILFTSGSTGNPKGVQVTSDCFDNFRDWAVGIGGCDLAGKAFINQAPFSFDLSVYELAMSISSGATMFALTKGTQSSLSSTFEALEASKAGIWVSTPSFADMCLSDKSFSESIMPNLEMFLFCGETLTNQTAKKLRERFPNSIIVNSYGPTESTVAVTEVVVTDEMIDSPMPLPVGTPRPGTRIDIVGEDGTVMHAGELGEIVIVGDTVALGYYGRPDLTEEKFAMNSLDGSDVRSYATGDEGFMDENGMLNYHGRLDLQVKLNGFRIELGDIEEHLRKLPQIENAAVLPAMRNGKISHLVAHVVSASERTESDFKEGLAIKEALKDSLPYYMIPKKIVFEDSLPMTPNGKLDRKAIASRG